MIPITTAIVHEKPQIPGTTNEKSPVVHSILSDPRGYVLKGDTLYVLACAFSGILCAINVYSVKWMARVQDSAMVVKLLAIVLLIITGLVYIGQGQHKSHVYFVSTLMSHN